MGRSAFHSIGEVEQELAAVDYLCDRGLATAIFLAAEMGQPLLLEGEVGVGKTEVAKAIAQALDRRLVRLQCYEGIDASQALYEWDYPRQLLYLRAVGEGAQGDESLLTTLYSARFLNERPLLEAIKGGSSVVLLIDEIDRADDEFEAFLLELLSEFQITIPELGTIGAVDPPLVVLTSNRTRELHDALKRRCLYHWIGYPYFDREVAIVRSRVADASEEQTRKLVGLVRRFRSMDLVKPPGVAETINWSEAIRAFESGESEADSFEATLGAVLKERDDVMAVTENIREMLDDLELE